MGSKYCQGIALVTVLWFLILLIGIASAFAYSARTETQLSYNFIDSTRSRLYAEAVIHRAIWELSRPGSGFDYRADGRLHMTRFEDSRIQYRISNEAGKIDLNRAPPILINNLLGVLSIAPAEATALADAIFDWRDRDQLRRLHGAEDDDYQRAGKSYGAKDGPFDSVSELLFIRGMTENLFEKLRPHVTIYTGSANVDPRFASRATLLALPGMKAEAVDALLDMREQQAAPGNLIQNQSLPSGPNREISNQQIFTITAKATLPSGASTVMAAVIRLSSPGHGGNFTILSWREADELDVKAVSADVHSG